MASSIAALLHTERRDTKDAVPVGGDSTTATPAPRHRDSLLDNVKFLLIVLVFVGHGIRQGEGTRVGDSLYFWVYLFHMPAFVLISGYLSKSYDGSGRRVDKLLTMVAGPYLIFWAIYALQLLADGRPLPGGPLDPLWVTWFLAALFVWRITVPVWRRLRWPVATSVVISLAAGVVETGDALGLTRILSLLPFFVVGLFLEPRHLELLRRRGVRICSALVLVGTAVLTYTHLERLSREWVYWRHSLVDRDFEIIPYGIPARVVFLTLAFVLTAALLSLTPRRQTWFTRFGAMTLYVYLLHGLVIRIGEQFGWYRYTDQLLSGHGELVLNVTMAIVWTFVLCSPWVRKATKWAVEPNMDWILRRGSAASGGRAERDPATGPTLAK